MRILNANLLSAYQRLVTDSQYTEQLTPRHRISGRISIGQEVTWDFYERTRV